MLSCVVWFPEQALAVIQDLLRVLIIRIACLNVDYASGLIKPVLSSINHHISEASLLSDTDLYKVIFKLKKFSDLSSLTAWRIIVLYCQVSRLLDFLASLLEHPLGKVHLWSLRIITLSYISYIRLKYEKVLITL